MKLPKNRAILGLSGTMSHPRLSYW